MNSYFDEVDMRIISVSKDLFLQQGIAQTEMKVIAEHAGISRRTLYRRFPSKDDIALYVTSEVFRELNGRLKRSEFEDKENGFERYAACMRSYCQSLIENKALIRLLDEFDQRFTGPYPQSSAAEDFVEYLQSSDSTSFLKRDFMSEGIEDGSIRQMEDVDFMCRCIDHALLAICERIIPREHHYLREHGHAQDFIWQELEMLLRYIQNS